MPSPWKLVIEYVKSSSDIPIKNGQQEEAILYSSWGDIAFMAGV